MDTQPASTERASTERDSTGPASTVLACTVVVPCYNEAARLNTAEFLRFLDAHSAMTLQFVNDCSTDGTLALLEEIHRGREGQVHVLNKLTNGGKGEAVREGMLEAIGRGEAEVVGFWDADLATPLDTIFDLLYELEANPHLEMVIGSRVRLLGRDVHRRLARHYLGRVFATVASVVLSLPIYDTQCGAKLFRVTGQLRQILAAPFISRWVFDVELFARYIAFNQADPQRPHTTIYEFPLKRWEDVAGSKVKPVDFLRAFGDVVKIYFRYLR